MRQLLAILFALCLIVPFLGTYSWLHVEKRQVRKEIKRQIIAGLDKNELVFLKFSRAHIGTVLRWHHSKEFEYLGQMYDVVEMEEHSDSIYYWCWWDQAETALNRQLEQLTELANGKNPENTNQTQRLTDFCKTLILPKHRLSYPVVETLQNAQPARRDFSASIIPGEAPPSPPPEIV